VGQKPGNVPSVPRFPGPDYIGIADKIQTSSGAAPTWTTSNGHASGAALAFQLGSTTTGSGYTLAVGPSAGTGLSQAIYYAPNIVGGTNTVTVTFDQPATSVDIRVMEYSGVSTTSPLDATAVGSGISNGGNVATANATTTFANELIVGAGMTSWAFNAAGPGFTVDTITTHDADIAEHEAVSTAGSYNASANLQNNSNTKWLMQMATFEAAGGATANVHYYFSDHLGSTSVISDSSGNTQQESDYYPYGGEIPVGGGDSNTYKFTGKERDSETGLDYFGARHYASNLARFMTPDDSSD